MKRARREPQPESVSDHLTLAVRDVAGQQADIDILIGAVMVDLFHQGQRRATFDRRRLGTWLGRPQGVLTRDDVTWTVAPSGVVLTIPPLFISHRLQAADPDALFSQFQPSQQGPPDSPTARSGQ